MAKQNKAMFNTSFQNLLVDSDDEESDDSEGETDCIKENESETSEDDDTEENECESNSDAWSDTILEHDPWLFTDSWGINANITALCSSSIDYYRLFFNSDILELIVRETNRYGNEKDNTWEPTNVEEMEKFFVLCLQMGIVKLPALRDYWSFRTIFGGHPIGSQVMTRYRYEQLLKHIHVADNASFDGSDRLYKISEKVDEKSNL